MPRSSSRSGKLRGSSRPPCNGPICSDAGARSDAPEPQYAATSGELSPSPSTATPSTSLPQLPDQITTFNYTEATVVQTGSLVFGERPRKRRRPLDSTEDATTKQAAQQAAAAQQLQQSPLQQQPVPLLQVNAEGFSAPPSSRPSFSSIFANLVGSSRHGEKRTKAKRPSSSQGGSRMASPSSSGERETTKNGSAGANSKSSAAVFPRLRKKAMLSPSAQPAAAGGATNGLPSVMGSGNIYHTHYRKLSPGGEEGSRPASADSVLRQPAFLDFDDNTLDGNEFQNKMLKAFEDHGEKSGGVSSPQEGWASTCQVGSPRINLPWSPAWPESAATPSLILQNMEQLLGDPRAAADPADPGAAGFLMRQTQNFGISSLLSCLHELRSENIKLESRISYLQTRRDQLLAVNAQLMGPLREAPMSNSPMPLVSHASASDVNAAAAVNFSTRTNFPTSFASSSTNKNPDVALGIPLGFPSLAQPATDHQPHQGNELSATSQHSFPGWPAMKHPEGVRSAENSLHRVSTLSTFRQKSNN